MFDHIQRCVFRNRIVTCGRTCRRPFVSFWTILALISTKTISWLAVVNAMLVNYTVLRKTRSQTTQGFQRRYAILHKSVCWKMWRANTLCSGLGRFSRRLTFSGNALSANISTGKVQNSMRREKCSNRFAKVLNHPKADSSANESRFKVSTFITNICYKQK